MISHTCSSQLLKGRICGRSTPGSLKASIRYMSMWGVVASGRWRLVLAARPGARRGSVNAQRSSAAREPTSPVVRLGRCLWMGVWRSLPRRGTAKRRTARRGRWRPRRMSCLSVSMGKARVRTACWCPRRRPQAVRAGNAWRRRARRRTRNLRVLPVMVRGCFSRVRSS